VGRTPQNDFRATFGAQLISTPAISVVLPCYNAHAFLGRALDSLRAQTFQDFEIVIVDDGSTERETIELLDALPDDIRMIRQKNRGLAGARNRGFGEAHAKLILPLDCDDWLAPEFLAVAYQAVTQAPEPSFAFADLALEGEADGVLQKPFNLFEQLFFNQLPYCMLMPRSAWEAIGGYDEAMRLGYEDWEFNIRLGLNGYTGIPLGKPYFHYWVSSGGMLASISRARHISLWHYIRTKHTDAYKHARLWARWREWRHNPSVRPLFTYLVWDFAYRILPDPVLLGLFRMLRPLSHSARENRRAARD
jgi:glycosyltransferase involved in cell wall biosynthesis